MTLVVDASFAVSALIDDGPTGRWARGLLASESLVAPQLMPAEAANILRRAVLAGDLSREIATQAHADLLDMQAQLYPYWPLAGRIWDLRENVTVYDAWYVALAELLDVQLATLDHRLATAPGTWCQFVMPPA